MAYIVYKHNHVRRVLPILPLHVQSVLSALTYSHTKAQSPYMLPHNTWPVALQESMGLRCKSLQLENSGARPEEHIGRYTSRQIVQTHLTHAELLSLYRTVWTNPMHTTIACLLHQLLLLEPVPDPLAEARDHWPERGIRDLVQVPPCFPSPQQSSGVKSTTQFVALICRGTNMLRVPPT